MIRLGSRCCECRSLDGRIVTPISSAKITATNQDATSAMATTANKENVYSPAALRAKPIGTKPATVTSVPVSIGKAVDVYAKVAACTLSQPSSSFVIIVSIVIMPSSTRRPRAMIRAPSETRCKSIPETSIVMNTIPSTRGIENATTAPARKPRLRRLTASTIAIASHRASMNSLMECFTTELWSATSVGSIPTGSSAVIVAMAFLIFWPRIRISPPSRIETATPIAG